MIAAHAIDSIDAVSEQILERVDSIECAQSAGLRYVTDAQPGIRRIPGESSFTYLSPRGQIIDSPRELERISALGIPPAWTDVWICLSPRGHIQATGRDAKGRKQYRYHARWREVRDATKYSRMIAFGEALPDIRRQVNTDLARHDLTRVKVVATVVALLDATHIRIGNDEYARQNDSYGLTTLRQHHANISGQTLTFVFRGKSGKEHRVSVSDRRLARIVKKCQELPGHELFQYLDETHTLHPISSEDVNMYIREVTSQDFTAKDFRTWAGTVIVATALREAGPIETETQAKKNIVAAIRTAADHLGNTPAICRKCYVHPAILAAYLDGSLTHPLPMPSIKSADALQPDEEWVLMTLRASASTQCLRSS